MMDEPPYDLKMMEADFTKLKIRVHINSAEQAAGNDPDFPRPIRIGRTPHPNE